MKPDLKADLELCNKATPGPWYRKKTGENFQGFSREQVIASTSSFATGNKVYAVPDGGSFPANDAEFIAQAREGWPHAIERALKAEEAVQSLLVALKKFEENLSRYVCGGWMCSNDDWHYARQEDRELCAEYCELGKVRKKFDEELVRILGVLGDE